MTNPRAHSARARREAFSLLEVVLVVTMLVVLATMAAPRYARAAARYRAEATARRIAADLTLARRSARNAGASRTVRFDPAGHEYSISDLPGLDDPAGPYLVALTARPYAARIASVDFGGDGEIVFDAYGAADSNGYVTVQVGEAQRTVVLQAAGGKAVVQ